MKRVKIELLNSKTTLFCEDIFGTKPDIIQVLTHKVKELELKVKLLNETYSLVEQEKEFRATKTKYLGHMNKCWKVECQKVDTKYSQKRLQSVRLQSTIDNIREEYKNLRIFEDNNLDYDTPIKISRVDDLLTELDKAYKATARIPLYAWNCGFYYHGRSKKNELVIKELEYVEYTKQLSDKGRELIEKRNTEQAYKEYEKSRLAC